MSTASDCGSCLSGEHGGHVREWGIRPGLIGGSYCACTGDCKDRARREWVAFMERIQNAPDTNRGSAVERVLRELDAMVNEAEYGTMPGVRMRVRRHWATRIRNALDGRVHQSLERRLNRNTDIRGMP